MKAFLICRMNVSAPRVDFAALGINANQCDLRAGYGAYLVAGTQLAIAALFAQTTNITGIVTVTETEDARWPELDGIMAEAYRAAWNAWATAHGFPTLAAGVTYRQAVTVVYSVVNPDFNLEMFDILDVPG